MGGKGSGRRPYYEALALEDLLQLSISTLTHALKSPDCPYTMKVQVALALASRRVGNKTESKHTIELTSQEQSIIDKYSKPIEHNVLGMITGSTSNEINNGVVDL